MYVPPAPDVIYHLKIVPDGKKLASKGVDPFLNSKRGRPQHCVYVDVGTAAEPEYTTRFDKSKGGLLGITVSVSAWVHCNPLGTSVAIITYEYVPPAIGALAGNPAYVTGPIQLVVLKWMPDHEVGNACPAQSVMLVAAPFVQVQADIIPLVPPEGEGDVLTITDPNSDLK